MVCCKYQLALHDYLCSSNGILVLQLKLHDDNGEENQDTTAHFSNKPQR
jgi:hypothetical protein